MNILKSLPILILLAACGGGDDASVEETGTNDRPESTATELPESLSFAEYNQLRDALDNDEVPYRVIHRIEPEDRTEYNSIEAAADELIDALVNTDLGRADHVFASAPEYWRKDLQDVANEVVRMAYKSGDYAAGYAASYFLHFNSNALWHLDGEYVVGRVVETGTGNPIAAATVTYQDRVPQSATTDDSGNFRLLLPARRTVNLLIEHVEHGEKRIFNHNGAPISANNLQGQVLEIELGTGYPKLTLRARIVDADTGEPLAGLPVVAGFDPIDGATDLNLAQVTGSFARETDAEGRVEIPGLPVDDIHLVGQAVLDGKLYALREEGVSFENGVEKEIRVSSRTINLDVPMIVVGTVYDKVTRQPVDRARVSAGGWKAERTDQNGRFMMQLATGEQWQLTATHEAYHDSTAQEFSSNRPQTIETEFFLAPITTGTILGTAINSVTGEPIVNAVIEIGGQRLRTDSQGRFRAEEIESGEVQVSGAQSGYRADAQTLLLEAMQLAEATLELEPITTGTVVGIVVDKQSGAPLANVAVRAGEVSGTTGADGRFVLEEVEAGAFAVGGSRSLYVPGSTDVTLQAMATVETRLELEAITWGTVRGVVSDARSGRPLVNATVRIGGAEVETDASGKFVAERVPAGEITIVAGLARYHDEQATIELARDGNAEQSFSLAPITTGTVIATVVDATSGNAIDGATVTVGQRRGATNNAGQVVAEEIPAGEVVVSAMARLYESGSATAVLDEAGEVRLEIRLIPITYGSIAGTVINSASGAPLDNAKVTFAGQVLRSDAQGNFRAERVPAGRIVVNAELFRYRGAQETVALERGTEQSVQLALEPITTGTVRGVVRNADTGQEVNGATVTIGNLSARSDSQGRFEIEQVPAGAITVRGSLRLFEPGESRATLEAAGITDTEIRLTPITYGTVKGIVVNADTDAPLADARISAGRVSARSDAAGEFELQRVSAGDVRVLGSKAVHIDDSTSISLAAGDTETVTLRLQPITWGVVTGTVIDAETARPLANARVTVAAQNVRTDGAGQFRAEMVPAGSLRVSGSMPAYESGSITANLAADGEQNVRLALQPIKIGDVRGRVVDAKTGEPVSNARVTTGRFAAETDTAGVFGFESVSIGKSIVAARHPDYANGSASANVVPAEVVEVTIELDLRREDVTNLEAELAKSGTIDLYGIYFDSGRDQFKPSSLPTLRAVLRVMKRAPERRFQIAGHTDSDGSDTMNQDLSERRARTVIGWLVDNGIEAGRIDGIGFGEARPAVPNDTETGKALNRRVQLSFAD